MLPPEEEYQGRQLQEDLVRLRPRNRVRGVKWQLVSQSRKKRRGGGQQSWPTETGHRVCPQRFLHRRRDRRDEVPEEDWVLVSILR